MYGTKSEERRDDVDDAAVRGACGRDTRDASMTWSVRTR